MHITQVGQTNHQPSPAHIHDIRHRKNEMKGECVGWGMYSGTLYQSQSDKHSLSNGMGLENNLAPPPAINDQYWTISQNGLEV
jgi:hypothetical protein